MNFRYHLPAVLTLLAVAPVPLVMAGDALTVRLLVLVLFFGTMAIGVNIAFGHTDQLLLFTGGMAGLSAYTVFLSANALGVSPFVTLVVGAFLAGLVGYVACHVTARLELSLIAVSMLTFAIQLSIIQLLFGLSDITGGAAGLQVSGLAPIEIQRALGVSGNVVLYYALFVILAGVLFLYKRLMNSQYGLAFEMIRQDTVAAKAIGIDVVRYKSIAGFLATAIIGLVGPFYAQLQFFVLPDLFTFSSIDVTVLIILVLGGLRTMYGPLLGAALIIFLNRQLSAIQEYQTAVYGLLLIVLFLSFRQGVIRFLDQRLTNGLDPLASVSGWRQND